MELFGPLLDILKARPDIFIISLLLGYGLLERQERQRMQKANTDIQGKMLEQNSETREALAQMQILLQILTQGRH